MKKIIASLLLMSSAISMNAAVNVNRIEPTDWYVGMKDASLQLMVYGKDIKNADVTVDYPGVKVDSIARLDSPNYLLVYLNLDGAKAGEMTLNFKQGKQSKKVKYVLKNREMAGDKRIGFSNEDVLYMLMPDRFANGNLKNDAFKNMRDKTCDRTAPSLRHGGDLEGIRQHLDYFNQLGVTALWFTPVLENDSPSNGKNSSYHGYATTNYYRVDPRFGTNADGMVIYRQHGQSMTSQMSRQLAHDGAIRFKISMLLENRPDFPQAGKFYGWLAHAAGSISSAYGLYPQSPQFALRLLDESAKAVLKAAVVAAQAKTDDAHLILAERYFAGEYLLRAGSFDAHSCRPLEKATGFLATRHSKLAGLTRSQLNARQKQLFTRLCCEHERVQATFKREGIFVSW